MNHVSFSSLDTIFEDASAREELRVDAFLNESCDRMSDSAREELMATLRVEAFLNVIDRMKCVVVNLQGYRNREKLFIVKELGVCFPDVRLSKSYFFKPPENTTLSTREELYCRDRLHRLSFDSGVLPYSSVIPILETLTKRRELYAKGLDQCIILVKLGFNPNDLEHFGCPRPDLLPEVSVTCKLSDHDNNLYCAERRALKFGAFLYDQIKTDLV